jgi:Tol biopolymer transport system component
LAITNNYFLSLEQKGGKERYVMNWLNCEKMRLMIVGFAVVLALGGGSARADFTFGKPTNLGPIVNSSSHDGGGPHISVDGLELYFSSRRPGGYGSVDLWVSIRETIDSEWSTPVNLGPIVNNTGIDLAPDASADGLELYFESRRSGGLGAADIWVSKRATRDDDWGPPENLGTLINTSSGDGEPSISSDGLELYYVTGSFGGDSDISVSTRATTSDEWSAPVKLTQVNPPGGEWYPSISADGRVLIFVVSQTWTSPCDIWMTIRNGISGNWNPPYKLASPINTSSDDLSADISADGRTLYFASNRPGGYGGYDLWQASINPVVDLNADGIVDSADMCVIVDHWGTDEPLCDIGPMPWGDGIVDVEDLIVLAEHLFEEFPPVE